MRERAQVDEYLGASGEVAVRNEDVALLQRYELRNGDSQCRYGCSACSCPEGVPIDEVLRTRMYDRDYGNPELARADYAALSEAASACASCSHQACTGTCPFGLPVSSFTRDAHARLARTLPPGGPSARG
jgi:hypothetical protein